MTSEADDEEELTVDLGDLAEDAEDMSMEEAHPEKTMGTGTVVLENFKIEEDKPSETMDEISDDEISLDLDAISDEGLEAAMALDKEDEEFSLGLESLGEDTEGLEEMELEPAGEFQEEMLDLENIDLHAEKSVERDGEGEPSCQESEMLTVELEEGKKKDPDDMKNPDMAGTAQVPDTSGQ